MGAVNSDTMCALLAENRRLSRESLVKTEVFREISADIRLPLLKIHDRLRKMTSPDTDTFHHEVQELTDISSDLSLLLENLLQWSKYHSQGRQPEPTDIKMESIVTQAITQQKYGALNKNIRLSAEMTGKPVMYADSDLMLAVLRVVLQNTIGVASAGGSITIVGRNTPAAEISITLKGYAPVHNAYMQCFNTGDHSGQTEMEKALHLGFLFCHEVLTACGGTISVAPTSTGMITTINLPMPVPTAR